MTQESQTKLDSSSDLHVQIAHGILWACWRGIPASYKAKYARSIWQQFEDNIRSAAYTSSLPRFLDALCRKLSIDLRAADVEPVSFAFFELDARLALRALRDETTYLVLMVRMRNEDRKEDWKADAEAAASRMMDPSEQGGLFGASE